MSVSSDSEGDNSFVQTITNELIPDIIVSSGSDREIETETEETKK